MVANARAGGWEEKLVVLCLCPSVVSSSSFVASHFLSTLVASGVVCLFVFMNVCMLGLASLRLRCLFNVILFQVFLSDFFCKSFFSLVFAVVGIVFLSLATTFISLVLNNTYIIKLLLLLLSSSSWTVTLTPQFRFHLLPDCYKVGNFFLLFFLACFVTNHFYFLFNTFAQQQKHKWFKVTMKTEGRGPKIEFELW